MWIQVLKDVSRNSTKGNALRLPLQIFCTVFRIQTQDLCYWRQRHRYCTKAPLVDLLLPIENFQCAVDVSSYYFSNQLLYWVDLWPNICRPQLFDFRILLCSFRHFFCISSVFVYRYAQAQAHSHIHKQAHDSLGKSLR